MDECYFSADAHAGFERGTESQRLHAYASSSNQARGNARTAASSLTLLWCVVLIRSCRQDACPGANACAAHGALAFGVPTGVARAGFAYGYSKNKATRDEARNMALYECRSVKNSTPQARRLCTLVRTYQDECVSIAMDPVAGTPGVGWAVAPTLHQAEAQALVNCRAPAGRSRRTACRIDNSHCDGNAK